jgi:hypothetical protein
MSILPRGGGGDPLVAAADSDVLLERSSGLSWRLNLQWGAAASSMFSTNICREVFTVQLLRQNCHS